MAQQTLEAVHQAYERVNASLELSPELFDEDLVMDLTDVSAMDTQPLQGADAAEAELREYWETFEDFHVDLREVLHADESLVVTAVRDGGRMKGSEVQVWNDLFHVWSFRDGKVVRFSSHSERSRALEAAGLAE